jgi:hypothetical protein
VVHLPVEVGRSIRHILRVDRFDPSDGLTHIAGSDPLGGGPDRQE